MLTHDSMNNNIEPMPTLYNIEPMPTHELKYHNHAHPKPMGMGRHGHGCGHPMEGFGEWKLAFESFNGF